MHFFSTCSLSLSLVKTEFIAQNLFVFNCKISDNSLEWPKGNCAKVLLFCILSTLTSQLSNKQKVKLKNKSTMFGPCSLPLPLTNRTIVLLWWPMRGARKSERDFFCIQTRAVHRTMPIDYFPSSIDKSSLSLLSIELGTSFINVAICIYNRNSKCWLVTYECV